MMIVGFGATIFFRHTLLVLRDRVPQHAPCPKAEALEDAKKRLEVLVVVGNIACNQTWHRKDPNIYGRFSSI